MIQGQISCWKIKYNKLKNKTKVYKMIARLTESAKIFFGYSKYFASVRLVEINLQILGPK